MKRKRNPLRLLSGLLASAVLAGALFPSVPLSCAAGETGEVSAADEMTEYNTMPQYEVTLHGVHYNGMDILEFKTAAGDDMTEADSIYLESPIGRRIISVDPGMCFTGDLLQYRRDAYTMFSEFQRWSVLDVTFITNRDFAAEGYTDESAILERLSKVAAVKCVRAAGTHYIGDVSDDGVIDTYDMILLREALAEGVDETLNEDRKANSDVTGEGEVTEDDLSQLSAYLLGAQDRFNVPPAIGSVRLDDTVAAVRSDGKKTTDDFAASQMNLGIKMLQQIDTGADDQILISPLSASAALTMTANGADSETLEEMEKLLGNGISLDDLNEYFSWFMQHQPHEKKAKVDIANSIWFRDCDWLKVHDSFLEKNKQYFESEIYKAAFDESTVKDINSWVDGKTNGMIPKLLDDPKIFDDPQLCMALINALYFEADWKEPYSYPGESEFTNAKGEKRHIDSLCEHSDNYYELDNALAFKKDFVGGYKFVGILPDEGISLEEYISSIDPEKLTAQLKTPGDMENVIVSTMIPKFRYEYSCNLKDILVSLGMNKAFSPETADFSKMGEVTPPLNLYISKVLQKTNIELTEKGVKAAAATVVMMGGGGMLTQRIIDIYLDRPFVYMIVDENDIPAFSGCISDFE